MISRRRFLLLGTVGTLVAGLGAGLPYVRRRRAAVLAAKHRPGPAGDQVLDQKLTATVSGFTAALFGRELTAADRDELTALLTFAASADSGWISEYQWLAAYADERAGKAGEQGFLSASPDSRDAVIREIMGQTVKGRAVQLLAMISEQERLRRRMMLSTVPHLRRIYLASGVPWRARGYQSWPGIPGDPRAYTRPGPVSRC